MKVAPRYSCPHCRLVFCKALARCPSDGEPLARLAGDPLIGQSVDGRYFIESCIGDGGMSRVYRARHQRMSKEFAVKILYGDHVFSRPMRERFAREADAISQMSHENVASVVDFGRTRGGLVYLVMDYAPGRSLRQMLDEHGILAVPLVRHIAHRLAAGLAHIHSHGIVHRDLKPDNIIVSERRDGGWVRIIDFGAALCRDDCDDRLTEKGTVIGTPGYMSPEQATGRRVDARSDLYSLGLIIFEMLWGSLPYDGQADEPSILAVPPSREQAIAPDLESIVRSLLHIDPGLRPTCAEEVQVALDLFRSDPANLIAAGPSGIQGVASHDTDEICLKSRETTQVSAVRSYDRAQSESS